MRKLMFVSLNLLLIAAVVLSACAAPTPVVVEKEKVVEKPVVETVIVEKEKVVEKPVVETVIVEKEVEVVVTPTPSPLQLGALEGPEIILDPAKFPTEYNEAPMLAALVEAGELPPVEERLPKEPLVIEPLHEIGTYGGTWRRGFTGVADNPNYFRLMPDMLIFYDYAASKLVPNVAKDWELSEDGTITTLFLREGLKWSDGEPLTADDFMFWYEHVFLNPELTIVPRPAFLIDGEPGVVEKVDDFTIRYVFPQPYFAWPEFLASAAGYSCQAANVPFQGGQLMPAHYLKQFHPDFIGEDAANALAQAEGFESWVALWYSKVQPWQNADLPVVSPWKVTTPGGMSKPFFVAERNPYYWAVDTEGNQLPYIDRIQWTLASDLEVLNLRALAGEYDFQARHIELSKLPLFLENQARGGYTVYLDPPNSGGEATIIWNISYQEDPEISKWFLNEDFRRALCLGVDRDQINEAFFLGIGRPGSFIPDPSNPFYPGDEYVTKNHVLDADQANQILDDIGLAERDAEGFRLRSDGQGPLVLTMDAQLGWFYAQEKVMEMIAEHWKEIGIKAEVLALDGPSANERLAANVQQIRISTNLGTDRLITWPGTALPGPSNTFMGQPAGEWLGSRGERGIEPPEDLGEIYYMWESLRVSSPEEQIRIGQDIWKRLVDGVWQCGTVGLAPVIIGVRVVRNNMGNIPGRIVVGVDSNNPSLARTDTFYFKY